MLEFNDYHIFAGEIKQKLASFNLPKYRGGKWLKTDGPTYFFGEDLGNYTRQLKIRSNAYDSYTHEYLGWYLRFVRDKKGIDLMPLYNCFSENACRNLELSFAARTGERATFDSSDSAFKIYSMPIMLGRKYTIAIDSSKPIELCCAIYDAYQADEQKGIPEKSYVRRGTTSFHAPFVYDTSALLEIDGIEDREADVRLILKADAGLKSSIVVLEGEYVGWNDTALRKVAYKTKKGNDAWQTETVSNHWITNYDPSVIEDSCANFKPITPLQLLRINSGVSHPFADRLMEYLTDNAITDDDEIQDNIKRAQRAMSYALTEDSEASEPQLHGVEFESEGVWEAKMRPMLYDSMQIDRYNGNDKNHDILGYVDKDVETYYHTVEWKDNHKNDGADLLATDDEFILNSKDPYVLHSADWDPLKYAYYRIHTIASEDLYADMYKDAKTETWTKG